MEAVKHALSLDNLRLTGLHCHIGSQIFEIKPYEDAAEIMLNYIDEIKRETGHEIRELDLGGGFGVYYTETDKPRSIEEYCSAILNKVNEICERLGLVKLNILPLNQVDLLWGMQVPLYTPLEL